MSVSIFFYGQLTNEYRFLSNFYPSPFVIDKAHYSTVEHYYQSEKCLRMEDWLRVTVARSLGEAKRIGSHVLMKANWSEIQLDVMRKGIAAKFNQNPHLLTKLRATGDADLLEDSPNMFWGWAQGRGKNMLGVLLMEYRQWNKENYKGG